MRAEAGRDVRVTTRGFDFTGSIGDSCADYSGDAQAARVVAPSVRPDQWRAAVFVVEPAPANALDMNHGQIVCFIWA